MWCPGPQKASGTRGYQSRLGGQVRVSSMCLEPALSQIHSSEPIDNTSLFVFILGLIGLAPKSGSKISPLQKTALLRKAHTIYSDEICGTH